MSKQPDIIDELRGVFWKSPNERGVTVGLAIQELTRLRQIEAAANAAGQITADHCFASIGTKVWHPAHPEPGKVEADDNSFFAQFSLKWYPMSGTYSTRAAAEASQQAKENA